MESLDGVDPQRFDPRLWSASHPVVLAFDELADAVRERRNVGTGRLSEIATSAETEFERFRMANIESHLGGRRPGELSVPLDLFAMQAHSWNDPVSAILYAASQAAAHHALRDPELDEPSVNSSLYETLPARLDDIVSAYRLADCSLPPRKFLHAGVAKMERNKDHMGADLAMVVGANVLGVPRVRVVLLQAKHADPKQRNRVNVGQNGGRQLDELLSTGMGYYLFYPRPVTDAGGRETRLMPLVRDARGVFADVASTVGKAARFMVGCHGRRDGTVDACDFAQFSALEMASDSLVVGRLFPSAETAAEALVVNGKPLAPEIVVVDRSRHLSVLDFLKTMKGHHMDTSASLPFPTWEDLKPTYGEDGRSSPGMP